jgi:hypothetical protein
MNKCGHAIINDNLFYFLSLKQIGEIFKTDFFKDRELVYCVKCNKKYYQKKKI